MAQGPITNLFAQLGTNPAISNQSEAGVEFKKGDLMVHINEASFAGFKPRLHKLFDIFCIKFTQANEYKSKTPETLNREVVVPLAQCIQLFGLTKSKSTNDRLRIQIKEHLQTLSKMSFRWLKGGTGNEGNCFPFKRAICEKAELKNGEIHFTFSEALAMYLNKAFIMHYPLSLLQVDEHNPNAYFIGRKLALHYCISNNCTKGTNTVLSVKSLLSVCPNVPSYESLRLKGRQYTQLIVEPLEKGLDALPFIKWHYRNQKGQASSYSTFLKDYILFELIENSAEPNNIVPIRPLETA